MVLRLAKILVAVGLSLLFTISLAKLVLCIWNHHFADGGDGVDDGVAAVEKWLDQHGLGKHKKLFAERGKYPSTLFLYSFNFTALSTLIHPSRALTFHERYTCYSSGVVINALHVLKTLEVRKKKEK